MSTQFYNKIVGSCESGLTDVITKTDDRYKFVKEQLSIAIINDKGFIDSMCKNLLDHKFILDNLHNIILVREESDENHILGLAAYDIIETRLQRILKLYTLCTNNKCGTLIIELIKHIGDVENCDCIKVISISPSIGFYWRMGFRFLIDSKCLFYTDNELARHERERFEETNEVLLESKTLEQLESYKLAWVSDDNYIMTYCLKYEDEYAYEMD
jgi:hypothetical protein